MARTKKVKRDYQYDFSERYIVRKDKVSRNCDISGERDNFSVTSGQLCMWEDLPDIEIGVQKNEYRLAKKRNRFNGRYENFYGEDV